MCTLDSEPSSRQARRLPPVPLLALKAASTAASSAIVTCMQEPQHGLMHNCAMHQSAPCEEQQNERQKSKTVTPTCKCKAATMCHALVGIM